MVSNKDYKTLCEIDEKMLDGKSVTEEEQKERIRIINEFNKEVSRECMKKS